MSEEQAVREVNERFYLAMNSLDIEEMDKVWAHVSNATCIHPGRAAITGYDRIRESWEMIFKGTDSMSIAASDERPTVINGAAWVICTETISMMMKDGLAAAATQATNIFQFVDGSWRMIVHHASPIPFTAQEEWPDVIN